MTGCHDLVAVLLHEGNAEEPTRTTVGMGKQQDDQDNSRGK